MDGLLLAHYTRSNTSSGWRIARSTSGNCITYAPVGTSTSSALVSSPSEAQTAHGRPSNSQSSGPSTLNSSTQSTVGFRPAATTSAQDGVAFPIGKMIHYNNPVYADDRYFTGRISAILGGFTSPNTVGFDWQLDVATGVAAAMRVKKRPEVRVIAQGGDGGTTDIG